MSISCTSDARLDFDDPIDSKLIYKVKYGEFLGKIARKFGVKVSDIKRWNNLKNDNIKENQKLIIFPKRIPIS